MGQRCAEAIGGRLRTPSPDLSHQPRSEARVISLAAPSRCDPRMSSLWAAVSSLDSRHFRLIRYHPTPLVGEPAPRGNLDEVLDLPPAPLAPGVAATRGL